MFLFICFHHTIILIIQVCKFMKYSPSTFYYYYYWNNLQLLNTCIRQALSKAFMYFY